MKSPEPMITSITYHTHAYTPSHVTILMEMDGYLILPMRNTIDSRLRHISPAQDRPALISPIKLFPGVQSLKGPIRTPGFRTNQAITKHADHVDLSFDISQGYPSVEHESEHAIRIYDLHI